MKSLSSASRNKETAKLLKRGRESLGLSQGAIARQLGLKNGQFISNIERNMCPIPLSVLAKLAKIYRIDSKKVIAAWLKDERTRLETLFKKN